MLQDIFSKITNGAGTISGLLFTITGLMQTTLGCKVGAGPLDGTCSAPWLATILPPAWTMGIGVGFAVLTLVGKVIRPGGVVKSLVGSTAVVVPADSPNSGRGTVSPAQVASH